MFNFRVKTLLLFILFISFGITVLYSSGVVYVDDDYTPATEGWNYDHFSYLQDAINAVEDSGIVYIMNGTYYNNYTINKPLSLIGESIENTIIDGNESGENLITIISTTNGMATMYTALYRRRNAGQR